jgi:uncharacterized low-complexity protein
MRKKTITPAVAIAGAALLGSLGATSLANAAENPFAADSMKSGYMLVAEAGSEDKCGGEKAKEEGKCGGETEEKMKKEGKCGEGKCGGAK